MTANIHLTEVASKNVHSLGHDPVTNTLAVRFRSKLGAGASVYHYHPVTSKQYADLTQAPSIGGHVQEHFVRNHHPFTKHDIK